MTLKFGTIVMIRKYSLKVNEFYVYDIYGNLPEKYWKNKGKIYHIPEEIESHGVVVFSGIIDGVRYPEDASPKDVYVGFDRGDGVMEVHQVDPGQYVIACEFFCMVIHRDKLNEFFTDKNFFKSPMYFN